MRRTELQHNEKFAMLNKSLEQTDVELNKVNQQHATLTAEVSLRLQLKHPNPHPNLNPKPQPSLSPSLQP